VPDLENHEDSGDPDTDHHRRQEFRDDDRVCMDRMNVLHRWDCVVAPGLHRQDYRPIVRGDTVRPVCLSAG